MRRTPRSRLALVTVLSAAVSAAGLRIAESRGATLLPIPALAWLLVLAIAAIVGGLGWNVRQYTRGKRPGLDVLVAARTVVLATASGYTGALLTGWYAAQVLVTLGDLQIESRRDVAVSAAIAVGAAVVLAVVGLVVERWCEVRPPDEDDEGPGSTAVSGSLA
jgi:hypothetical protein